MLISTKSACITGMTCHQLFGDNHEFLNQVKGRIDIVLDIKKYHTFRQPTRQEIESDVIRMDGLGLYWQSADLLHFSSNRQPAYYVMDNYSEVTDKRFEHKKGYVFAGHYGHIREGAFNENELTDHGMLNVNSMQDKYDEYFDFMKHKWPNTPFIFVHFPIEQETRQMYIDQWNGVTAALENLAGKYNIQNIHADKDQIEPVGDGDCYHYTEKTAINLASKIVL